MPTRLIGLAVVLALGLAVAPLAPEAEQAGKVPRVALFSVELVPERIEAFRKGLRQLGYVEGRNIAIELRSAEGKSERLPSLAAGLVGLKIDVIVAAGAEAIRTSQQATKTIPIVMVLGGIPIASGFVAGLPRPEGNITGLAAQIEGLSAKRLQLIKETVPKVTRVAVLWRRVNPAHQPYLKEIEGAAPSVGVRVYPAEGRDPADLDSAFSAMTKAGVGAVLVLGDNMFEGQRRRIVDLAARSRLPTIYFARLFVEAGGLMSYGVDQDDAYRRATTFVDKILKGAKPGDLPVEQPTKFDLVINLKTAKALGIAIPPSLLLRADQVLE